MTKKIPLKGQNGKGLFALVDDADYEFLSQRKWHARTGKYTTYAQSYTSRKAVGGRRTLSMHRVILDAPENMDVDHVNGNGLDNRRENIRLATDQQNNWNSGIKKHSTNKYKGIYKHGHNWKAEIRVSGKHIPLGHFPTQFEAANAYNEAAKKFHGEFYHFNDLSEGPSPDDIPYARKTSSVFHGVNWVESRHKWKTRIAVDGKRYLLGEFSSEIDAALAYNHFVTEHNLDRPLNIIDYAVASSDSKTR